MSFNKMDLLAGTSTGCWFSSSPPISRLTSSCVCPRSLSAWIVSYCPTPKRFSSVTTSDTSLLDFQSVCFWGGDQLCINLNHISCSSWSGHSPVSRFWLTSFLDRTSFLHIEAFYQVTAKLNEIDLYAESICKLGFSSKSLASILQYMNWMIENYMLQVLPLRVIT